MIIDFHTHTFPDKIAALAIPKMETQGGIRAFSTGTESALRASMRFAGITHSVVLPVATNPLKVRSINDISIEKNGKEGLYFFGCMHPDTEDAPTELERLQAAGIKGIKLHPLYQQTDIDDPRYLSILAKAAKLDMIVVLHAGDDIGYPDQVRCSPQMLRRVIDQVGNIKLVAAHMGGWQNWKDVAKFLSDTDIYIDTSFSLGRVTPLHPDSHSDKRLQLMNESEFVELVRSFGSQRVLFGSDSPWADQHTYLQAVQALPLSKNEMDDILFNNAKKLLNI